MTDRYAITSRDWQRFDRRYAVIDTQRPYDWMPHTILQTNDLARAIECRDEMNAEDADREHWSILDALYGFDNWRAS
jgi:hypothetical protein